MRLKNNILSYVLVPLIVLSALSSFYRFMVLDDYMVKYEIDCDPTEQACYEYCETDDADSCYPYSYIVRHAAVAEELCGVDITECVSAAACLPSEKDCGVEHCDPTTDECVTSVDL